MTAYRVYASTFFRFGNDSYKKTVLDTELYKTSRQLTQGIKPLRKKNVKTSNLLCKKPYCCLKDPMSIAVLNHSPVFKQNKISCCLNIELSFCLLSFCLFDILVVPQ